MGEAARERMGSVIDGKLEVGVKTAACGDKQATSESRRMTRWR